MHTLNRELHQLTQNSLNADSPFHTSHAQSEKFTDATIYMPPPSTTSDGPQLKKRRRDVNGADTPVISPGTQDAETARFSGHILANKHMSQHVHPTVKRECEQLVAMVVRVEAIQSRSARNSRCLQDEVKLWVTLTMPKYLQNYFVSL
jgi:proteasome activator subunit 3 (PA28 gamma)